MAIAFDAVSNVAAPNSTDAFLSWNHTCSGTNRFFVVGIQAYSLVAGADIVSSVTYNSVAMTRLSTIRNSGAGTEYGLYYYYLYGPATGTNNVTVTYTTAPGFGASWAFGISYTGVNQSGFPDGSDVGTGMIRSSVKGSIVTALDNTWVSFLTGTDDGPTLVALGGTTRRATNAVGSLARASIFGIFDSNAGKSPPGLVSCAAGFGNSATQNSGTMIVAGIPELQAAVANMKSNGLPLTGAGQ